jgi:flagellar assembly factor FliW
VPRTIDSTRFGRIEVADGSELEFPHGLVGLGVGSSRFTLVAREQEAAFVWLHSLEDPSLALPLTDPRRFFPGYAVELAEGERERLGLPDDDAAVAVYVTVRATAQAADCTANLRAPILVAAGRGHQVINQADDAPLRAPLFAAGETAPARAAV